MKKLFVIIAATMLSAAAYAQSSDLGALVFYNKPAGNDAPVKLGAGGPGAENAGPGALGANVVTADLVLTSLTHGGATTTPNLVLTPTTTYRTTPAAALFYVNNKDVQVPGSSPGDSATFVMRSYSTSAGSYDAAKSGAGNYWGASDPFTIALGGGTGTPANLTTLKGFSLTFNPVPEPSTIALGLLGAAALLIRRRK